MTALGFIETKGLLAAVAAADAMLKAADVRLLEKNLVGGGLVCITVAGEVSAVKASVDAAAASLRGLRGAVLVASHVIARPDTELARVVALKAAPAGSAPKAAVAGGGASAPAGGRAAESKPKPMPAPKATPPAEAPAGEPVAKPAPARLDAAQLKKMGLERLRRFAAGVKGLSLSKEKIASADRRVLLEAIMNAYRK